MGDLNPEFRRTTVAYAVVALGILGSLFLSRSARAQAAFIDPDHLTATSDFNPTTSDVSIDTTSGTMTGGASASAYSVTQAGSTVWVFVFNTFTLPAGRNITFYGSGPVVFLSHGDMIINGVIHADGISSAPGPGGFGGGHTGTSPANGSGQGAGSAAAYPGNTVQNGGGGGGFGGAGGAGAIGQSTSGASTFPTGGVAYGVTGVENQLIGGSGGGGGASANAQAGGIGGGGGGAIQFGAIGTLTVGSMAVITANGGTGGNGSGFAGGGGGGSGGGILFHAPTIDLQAGATITADGGNAGGGGASGGGGGGGRIEAYYRHTGTNAATVTVDGGIPDPTAGGQAAGASSPGSVIFAQSDAVPPVPYVPPANQAPTLKLLGKTKITTTSASVTVKGTARDDAGVQKVTFQVGRHGRVQKAKGTVAWKFNAVLKPGSNPITIQVIDSDGAHSAPVTLIVIRKPTN